MRGVYLFFLSTILLAVSPLAGARPGNDATKKTEAAANTTADNSTPAKAAGTTATTTTATGSTPAAGANGAVEAELQQLRELLEAQQAEIAALKERLNGSGSGNGLAAGTMAGSTASAGAISPNGSGTPSASLTAAMPQSEGQSGDSNMSFKIGGVNFTPGGFVDFSNYWRSTNVGSGFGTSFNTIPFNNTSAGGLTEDHLTAVNSRLNLKLTSHVAGGDVLGYIESDFNGNQPTNLLINRNGATLRLRLYFADYRRGDWEILGGQDWTLLTPNRVGINPMPSDIFTTLLLDANNSAGLVSARQPQFRLVYHPTEHWAIAVSVENPDQYTGTAITFPSAFNPSSGTTYTGQVDQGTATSSPAYFPDIIAKIARDQQVRGKDWHFEVAGLLTSDKLYTPSAVTGGSTATQSKTGGGIAANIDLALTQKFHLIANSFWSDGGGRYIYALGPNFVVAQDAASLNFVPSLVHAGSGLAGFEWQATRKFQWFTYYGGAYFSKNFSVDPLTGKDVGYGYPGSANTMNREIQEISTGFVQSFWKSENYGALQLINQVSYVTRSPWSQPAPAAGAPFPPNNAHMAMVYVDLRYLIP
jgi:hypothetical protein